MEAVFGRDCLLGKSNSCLSNVKSLFRLYSRKRGYACLICVDGPFPKQISLLPQFRGIVVANACAHGRRHTHDGRISRTVGARPIGELADPLKSFTSHLGEAWAVSPGKDATLKSVLLIDDDIEFCDMLRDYLSMHDIRLA